MSSKILEKVLKKTGILNLVEILSDQLWNDAAQPLAKKFSHIQISFDQHREAAKNYYENIYFRINLTNQKGESFDLVDGGFTDWTQKMISNEKERLLTSGLGTELLLKVFNVEL